MVKQVIALAARSLADLLFPASCSACGRRLAENGAVCGVCWSKLRFLDRPWCDCLGTPLPHELGENALSVEAIASPPPFGRARAAVAYSGPAMPLVRGLKFHDRTELAPLMARWMLRVSGELVPDADFVTPVPLHRFRMLKRRYNQSAELARCFASLCGLAFEPAAVARVKGTRQQVGLDARQRESNVRGAFRVPVVGNRVRGKRVLLIDDVYTTGATVSAVARALRKAGAKDVDVLTFARVLPEDFAA